MRNLVLKLSLFLLIISTLNACKKASTAIIIKPNNIAPAITPPADADGMFTAQKVVTKEDFYITSGDCEGKTNTMVLQNQLGNGSIMQSGFARAECHYGNLGKVQCNNVPLSLIGGCVVSYNPSYYTYIASADNPSGIPFQTIAVWNCTGDTGTHTTAINYTDSATFPVINDIYTTGDVTTTGNFTLQAVGAVTGDSVIFSITGPKGTVQKTAGPNTAAQNFTAAEMASIGTTDGLVGLLQIAPYSLNAQIINGKKQYFVKETCLSKYVNLK